MYSQRRQTARKRWLMVVGVFAAIILVLLSWWQAASRRHGTRSPVEQLLITILTPSLRATAALRDEVTPDPHYSIDPQQGLPRTGMERLKELEEENRQLRELLSLRNAQPKTAISADVIGRNINPWQGNLILGKGKRDGVDIHMVALTPDGVLGQVLTVTDRTAEILLLTDRASGIGAMIARTRETGVLKGDKEGRCLLMYLSNQAIIEKGDEVITSGLSDYYPKGLPLGTVIDVRENPALSSRTAIVKPAANPSTAELVVLTK